MNTLNIIRKQIEKASAAHDAQIHLTKYRGTTSEVHQAGERPVHVGHFRLSRSYLYQVSHN